MIRARVIFRQPPLSSISNIYLLPFNRSVWYSCGGLILIIAIIIIFQLRLSKNGDEIVKLINIFDLITFISGAVCQQGIIFLCYQCALLNICSFINKYLQYSLLSLWFHKAVAILTGLINSSSQNFVLAFSFHHFFISFGRNMRKTLSFISLRNLKKVAIPF